MTQSGHHDEHGTLIENYHMCGCRPPRDFDIEILGEAYRAAQARAGAFDELDKLRQAVMIRNEYRRLDRERWPLR